MKFMPKMENLIKSLFKSFHDKVGQKDTTSPLRVSFTHFDEKANLVIASYLLFKEEITERIQHEKIRNQFSDTFSSKTMECT
jgi:hypothetical protein